MLDQAGWITPGSRGPLPGHAVPACRCLCETAPVLSSGDLGGADRGVRDGATITWRTQPRHGDVMGPWHAQRVS